MQSEDKSNYSKTYWKELGGFLVSSGSDIVIKNHRARVVGFSQEVNTVVLLGNMVQNVGEGVHKHRMEKGKKKLVMLNYNFGYQYDVILFPNSAYRKSRKEMASQ